MPILSVYISEELFQRLEKARVGRSRSSFIVSILNEKLSGMEGPTPAGPEESTKPQEDDPFYRLHEYEEKLKQYEAGRIDPKSAFAQDTARNILKYRRKRHGLEGFPADYTSFNEEQIKRLWSAVFSELADLIWSTKDKIEDYKLDGLRDERCRKLVKLSLKKLREIHEQFTRAHDFRGPTIREFASLIGVSYQKAANIASLLGPEYKFVSEKEKRKHEAEWEAIRAGPSAEIQ